LENFKRALLDAKSITYLPVPGVPQIIERLGLKDALAAKTTIPKTDLSSELVAKGEVELAIVPVTQAFTTPGVELAGTSAVGDSVLHRVRWRDQRQLKVARRRSGVA
jgi:hypothetical protein